MGLFTAIKNKWQRLFESSAEADRPSGFSYYAFISYTEKDEKWAKWLQWNLEHYKIPTKVRNERRELPSRVRPVFWYKNDLAGAHLSGAIKKELQQSKYMIVVCSPASARKEWVNDEVRYFKEDLGRGDKIIPFVVDGTLNAADPSQECLPLPIRNLPREKELRGIDVRAYGKKKALVNIVSTLFGIRYDILWNRFRREQQRRFAVYGVAAVLCALVLFGCWDYFLRTKYEYYVDMEDCNGMPTGIIQVDNDDARNHYRLYRFEYRRRMLQRVVYVDSQGNPQEHTNTEMRDRPCMQELVYNDGDLSAITCKNAIGRTLYVMHLSKDKLAVDLKDENENQGANFIYSSTSVDQGDSQMQQSSYLQRLLKAPSKIARYVYERDDDGYIVKKMYARHNGDDDDISIDANGISGFEYERDAEHRVVRIRFLDSHGNYKANHVGVAGKRYEYDEGGNLSVVEYVDKWGELKYNEQHWAKGIDVFDDKGFLMEERLYGADGRPCTSALGYHKFEMSYKGNETTMSLFDTHGKPTYALSFGNIPGGYSIMTEVRNEKGQPVEACFKDANGRLCFNQQHVATMKVAYDENGQPISVRNYGPDFKPCLSVEGYHYMRNAYNGQGNVVETSFFNVSDEPAVCVWGFHRIAIKYDGTGNRVTEVHTYNMVNLPMPSPLFNGAAWIRVGYHGSSKWVSDISFYTIDDKPAETNTGARLSCTRDSYGQITEYRYYNAEGELSSNAIHPAVKRLAYNDMGMDTEMSIYDEDEKPTTVVYGVHRMTKSYTTTGLLEKICNYDTLQHLTVGSEGWAIQEMTYANGTVSSVKVYGKDNEPIEVNGVHMKTFDIDDCGYVISQRVFDKDLKPAMALQEQAHKVVYIYDDSRRVVETDYYDTTGDKPFVCIKKELNARGMPTIQAAYNAFGEPIESPLNYGVAKIEQQYDAQDRITYVCCTDRRGKMMNSVNGIAEQHARYGENITETVYLNAEGGLANNASRDPMAYSVRYMTDLGKPLYAKNIRLSDGNGLDSIRQAICYDPLGRQAIWVIKCTANEANMYDAVSGQRHNYFAFDGEYDRCVQMVDSIRRLAETEYGKPQFEHYIR